MKHTIVTVINTICHCFLIMGPPCILLLIAFRNVELMRALSNSCRLMDVFIIPLLKVNCDYNEVTSQTIQIWQNCTYKAIPICIDKPAHNGYMIIIMDNMFWTRVGIVKWPELRSPPFLYCLQPVDALQWDDDNVEVAKCWPMRRHPNAFMCIFLCSLCPAV